MDPEDFPALLDRLHTTTESRLQLLQLEHEKVASRSSRKTDLDDDGIATELQKVRASISQPILERRPTVATGPFVLLSVYTRLSREFTHP